MRPHWLLDRFQRVTDAGIGRWRAACPVCGGTRRLSIGEADDRYLVRCFAGCNAKDVLAHIDLRFSDLRYDSGRENTYTGALRAPSPVAALGEVDHLLNHADDGDIEPIPVRLPRLPKGTTPAMRRVADFYRKVRGVRLWAGDDRPVIFSAEWVAGHLGLHPVTVWRALTALCTAGVLVHVESLPGRGGRRGPWTYLPGALAGGDERDELIVGEPAVKADAPHVEAGRVEPGGEPSDVVSVLEAPVVVRGGGASGGAASPGHVDQHTRGGCGS
jgi:hypothetical protein